MSAEWQLPLAWLIVAVASVWLIRTSWAGLRPKRRRSTLSRTNQPGSSTNGSTADSLGDDQIQQAGTDADWGGCGSGCGHCSQRPNLGTPRPHAVDGPAAPVGTGDGFVPLDLLTVMDRRS